MAAQASLCQDSRGSLWHELQREIRGSVSVGAASSLPPKGQEMALSAQTSLLLEPGIGSLGDPGGQSRQSGCF